ncbi:MAG: GNAT family N-acetyltransferase [Actinomycetes bacterium]
MTDSESGIGVAEPVVPVPHLPAPYSARPLDYPDARTVYELTALCDEHDLGSSEVEFEDIDSDWKRPSFEPRRDDLGIFAGDELVGYAEVYKGFRAEVHVHPAHRGRGLGTVLLQWTEAQARSVGGTEVGQTVSDSLTDAVRLFQRHGYVPRWTSWALEMDLHPGDDDQPTAASFELAEGYRLRDANLADEADVRSAYRVIEDAFNEWPNRQPSTFEDWRAMTLGREGFQPWQLPLVTRATAHREEIVGAAVLTTSFGSGGWVHQLAVRADSRGLGLARALLVHAQRVFASQGHSTMGLSTDSRTGALGLYERVGMHVRLSFTSWARRLDRAAAE